jgi:hypothetical protein
LADAHVKAVRPLLDGAESTTLNLGTGCGSSVRELQVMARLVLATRSLQNVGTNARPANLLLKKVPFVHGPHHDKNAPFSVRTLFETLSWSV